MFGKDIYRPSDVQDGMAETIMLIEVNDELAIDWTAPGDYSPKNVEEMLDDLGKLRGDGVIAMWGNGWPTYLPVKDKYFKDLVCAFTAEKGDTPVMGKLHRPVPGAEVLEASVASVENKAGEEEMSVSTDNSSSRRSSTSFDPGSMMTVDDVTRAPVPSTTQLGVSMEKLRRLYGKKVRDSKSRSAKEKLVEELLAMSGSMQDSPVDAYAVLQLAYRIANESGKAGLFLQCVDRKIYQYELDPYTENIKSIGEFIGATSGGNGRSIEGEEEIAKRVVTIVYASIIGNDFIKGSAIARSASRLQETRETKLLLNQMASLMARSGSAFDEAKEHLVSLRINPEDQIAAARFGQFLCFVKGDWDQGLEMIAQGENEEMVELAKADLKSPSDPQEQVAIGDKWLEMSRRATGVYRSGAEHRAAFWYGEALPGMTKSLDRMHVEFQLKEMKEEDPGTPIDFCKKLAKELGVDLNLSLIALASGQDSKKKKYNDDDDG